MKRIICLIFALLCCLVLASPCLASEIEDELDLEALENAVPPEIKDMLGGASPEKGGVEVFERLAAFASDKLGSVMAETVGSAVKVVIIAAMSSIVSGLNMLKGKTDFVNLGGCTAAALLMLGDVNSLVSLGRETMGRLFDFSNALLPTLCSAAAASGAVSSSAAKYAATALFTDILTSAANTVVFPLICSYAAVAAVASALPDGRLDSAVRLMKKGSSFALTGLMTAFTVYLSVCSIAASSADAAALKAAKTAISTALPVVGSIASNAAGAILSGAGMVRSAVGVFGLAAVLAICLTPFLRLGVRYLIFKLAAAAADAMTGGGVGKLIDNLCGAYGMIMGLVGSAAVFIFFGTVSLIRTVTV